MSVYDKPDDAIETYDVDEPLYTVVTDHSGAGGVDENKHVIDIEFLGMRQDDEGREFGPWVRLVRPEKLHDSWGGYMGNIEINLQKENIINAYEE